MDVSTCQVSEAYQEIASGAGPESIPFRYRQTAILAPENGHGRLAVQWLYRFTC